MGVEEQAIALQQEASRAPAADTDGAAERLSANCFFNALLRETEITQWVLQDTALLPAGVRPPAVHVALPTSDISLWLNATYRSVCGRHQFKLPVRYQTAEGRSDTIALADAVYAVALERTIFPQSGDDQRRHFHDRALMSMRNMAQALAARNDDCRQLFHEPLDFGASEQALLCGHTVHPTPKSREPLTDAEAHVYAPEFGNTFTLRWLAVAREALHGASGCDASPMSFAAELRQADSGHTGLPDGFVPLPAHPWQWDQLRRDPQIAELLADGRLLDLGDGTGAWRPTSSLRSVHGNHSPYMLKFSLSLRLTNSLRTLLPEEMARGLEVPRIRRTPVGRELASRYPRFRILAEPAYLLLNNARGEPIPESLVLFRENPFRGEAARNVCVLATLTQDHPGGGNCRAANLAYAHARRHGLAPATACAQWFERFLDAVVEPLLVAQADYGLLFGAHQQNLILAFEDELPVAGYFRDCQGSGYSALGISLLKPHLPELGEGTGNVLDDDMANRLFAYYLIVNSCFGLIGALAAAGLCSERHLLARLRRRLEKLHAGPRRDRSCLDYLLDADTLWAKGNFQCAIVGLNETTTADPLVIYHRLPNPLNNPETRIQA